MKKITGDERLKIVRSGLRLKVKAPKTETPKNVYSRKTKHKGGRNSSFSFVLPQEFSACFIYS